MKDKLYKNHHRGIYYRLRAFFFIFVLAAGAIAVAVIPTYIAIKENIKEPTRAAEEEVESDNTDDNGGEEINASLTYL